MPRFARRLCAALLGFVAAVAAVEGGLRIYGWILQMGANRRLRGPDDGRPLVAFIGDSNIYGLYLDAEAETLPKQVEVLSQAGGARGVRCVNLALPAAASWAVLEQCRRALELEPVAIVARTGINNTWQFPPGAGLGFFESLKIVRFFRIWQYNRAGREAKNLGGAWGEDATQMNFDAAHALLSVPPRDGDAAPLAITRSPSVLGVDRFGARLRADLEAMAELCEKARVRLVFATYLAGTAGGYSAVGEVMQAMRGVRGVAVADCARELSRAVSEAESRPPGATPSPIAVARRAMLLTRDNHPTALGYAIEARVVAKSLFEAKILASAPEDPQAPMRSASVDVPKIRLLNGDPPRFEVAGAAGDRVTLLWGPPGRSVYKEMPLSLDWKVAKEKWGWPIPAAGVAPIPKDGRLYLTPTLPANATIPPRVAAVALIERGGAFGAARVLVTPTIDVALPPK